MLSGKILSFAWKESHHMHVNSWDGCEIQLHVCSWVRLLLLFLDCCSVKACSSPAFFFSFHRQRASVIACLCCCHMCRHSHACSSGKSRISASRDRVCVLSSEQSLFTHVFLSRLFQLALPNPLPPFLSVEVTGNLSQVVFQLYKA